MLLDSITSLKRCRAWVDGLNCLLAYGPQLLASSDQRPLNMKVCGGVNSRRLNRFAAGIHVLGHDPLSAIVSSIDAFVTLIRSHRDIILSYLS